MTTPTPSPSEAMRLAEEVHSAMLTFAEEVWQAGTEGFNTSTVAPCREARANAEAAIDSLRDLAALASTQAAARPVEAVLPVVTYRYMRPGGDFHYTDYFDAEDPDCIGAESLALHAPTQATIDELRAEVERLTMQVENLSAAGQLACEIAERLTKERDEARHRFKTLLAQEHALSDSYVRIREMVGAMNPPALTPEALFPYVEASVAAAIKEKQIDVEAVMRLAEVYAKASSELDESIRSRSRAPRLVNRHDLRVHVAFKAAREALRASLLGDGGTL